MTADLDGDDDGGGGGDRPLSPSSSSSSACQLSSAPFSLISKMFQLEFEVLTGQPTSAT